MKGIQGLILAIVLGLIAAFLNWAYLTRKSADVERVAFVGIKPDATLARGDRLKADHLVPVGIPERWVGNLKDFAIPYVDRQTAEGMSVCRAINGGSLLLRDDLKTPLQELKFGQEPLQPGVEERALSIPFDHRQYVPSLILPGEDVVSFLVPTTLGVPTRAAKTAPAPAAATSAALAPTPAEADSPSETEPPKPAPGVGEIIGPFKILALGNRLGSSDVMQANKIRQVQENVMTISVKVNNGQLEPKAQKLVNLMYMSNFRPLGILLHPRKTEKH